MLVAAVLALNTHEGSTAQPRRTPVSARIVAFSRSFFLVIYSEHLLLLCCGGRETLLRRCALARGWGGGGDDANVRVCCFVFASSGACAHSFVLIFLYVLIHIKILEYVYLYVFS